MQAVILIMLVKPAADSTYLTLNCKHLTRDRTSDISQHLEQSEQRRRSLCYAFAFVFGVSFYHFNAAFVVVVTAYQHDDFLLSLQIKMINDRLKPQQPLLGVSVLDSFL